MSKPIKICLLMGANRDWVGGTEYIKNLVLALGSLPAEVRQTFELFLVVRGGELSQALKDQLEPCVSRIYYLNDVQQSLGLFSRFSRKLLKLLLKKSHKTQLERFIEVQKFDFVYPYLNLENSPAKCRYAAWIPDFQHKYLPHLFSQNELDLRDQKISRIARLAPIVVLSSKAAKSHFREFFPESIDKVEILSFKSNPSEKWYNSNPEEIQQLYCLPDRFFLVSNQFWQHKNHLLVFDALKLLQERSIYPFSRPDRSHSR
jgi:glycosyltransferase involved in cell wall biosynthesis